MKKIIIGTAIVIALALIAVFFLAPHSSPLVPSSPSAVMKTTAPVPIQGAPTSTEIILGTPHGSVTMKNFYLSSVGAEEQYIILARNNNYEITYDPGANRFYLSIAQQPYETNRTQAETDFLARLGIGKPDACKLTVAEGFADTQTGASLSFCHPGL